MNHKTSELKPWEREEISKGIYAYEKLTRIAKRLGRSPSTITREVKKQVKSNFRCPTSVITSVIIMNLC
jgi:IS30 family transposase